MLIKCGEFFYYMDRILALMWNRDGLVGLSQHRKESLNSQIAGSLCGCFIENENPSLTTEIHLS